MAKKRDELAFTPQEVVAYRESLGMTQREFCDAFNIPLTTLRNWEQERSGTITRSKLDAYNKIVAWVNRQK